MASILNVFEPKTKILSAEVNENFELVQSDVTEMGRALNTFVESEVTSLQSNLSSAQATLQNNINTVSSKLSNIYDDIAPDYGAGYSVSSGWTAPKAGWLACYGTSGEGAHTAWYVDGAEVFRDDQSWGGGRAGGQGSRSMAFVAKGSAVTRSGNNNTAMFYPCKGVQ